MIEVFRERLQQTVRSKTSLRVGKRFFSETETPLFTNIEIELRSVCNNTCSFCAAAIQYKRRPDLSMPEETFDKILRDLSELQYTGRICFYVNTEPLVDNRLPDFVSRARTACPKAVLHVMTNGILLNNQMGADLLNRGLDLLEINNYSEDDTLRPNIQKFMAEVAPRYADRVMLNKRKLMQQLNNRAGSAPNGKVLQEPLKAFCQRPFEKMMINTQGAVGLCEHDFYFSGEMGNVNHEHLLGIWHGEKFKTVRQHLLRGDRTISPLCAQCDYHGYRRISNPRDRYRSPIKLVQGALLRLQRAFS